MTPAIHCRNVPPDNGAQLPACGWHASAFQRVERAAAASSKLPAPRASSDRSRGRCCTSDAGNPERCPERRRRAPVARASGPMPARAVTRAATSRRSFGVFARCADRTSFATGGHRRRWRPEPPSLFTTATHGPSRTGALHCGSRATGAAPSSYRGGATPTLRPAAR